MIRFKTAEENSKFEIRNKSKCSKLQCSKPGGRFGQIFGIWDFSASSLFRISGFGFGISATA
jgi:hypothetical protein